MARTRENLYWIVMFQTLNYRYG